LGSGWSAANAWYQIPADGDWQFSWLMGTSATANANREFASELVVNSGAVFGNRQWCTAASQAQYCAGSYLYVNARAGDRLKVVFYNGDASGLPLAASSGSNYFTGWQIR
jgi:hypothetical protein